MQGARITRASRWALSWALSWALLGALVGALSGCGESGDDGETGLDGGGGAGGAADAAAVPDPGAPDAAPDAAIGDAALPDAALDPATPTWHRDVQPIFARACLACHRPDGIGPFDFTTAWTDRPPPWVAPAVAAVTAGTMPPWPPDAACREYRHSRALTAAERETIVAWGAAGHPAGDPADAPPPRPDSRDDGPPPDLVLDAGEAYAPTRDGIDDYRCLPLAHAFEEDTWVTRIEVRPDQAAMVHHVVTYLIPPEGSAELDRLDRVAPGPGYRCFGDARVYPASFFSVWAPGNEGFTLPDGAAIQIPAGSTLVMQMHYNLLAQGPEPAPDRTAIALWTLPPGVAPTARIDVVGFADVWLDIPAGAPAHVSEQVFRFADDGEIVAVAPHMHLLGERIRLDVEPAAGEPTCLVDIPRWDFDWQDAYWLREGEGITVAAGDALRMSCTHDNSPAAQPIVDGMPQSPRPVGWGDGTLDEMCLAFALVRRPVDAPYRACAGAAECGRDCAAGDADCLYRCLAAGGVECLICAANEWIECAFGDCAAEGARFLACINSTSPCGGGACVVDTCLAESDAIHACSHARLMRGGCDGRLRRCGLEFGAP
ncbi:MAG: hypothetical protein R3F65_06225 [bacterium]